MIVNGNESGMSLPLYDVKELSLQEALALLTYLGRDRDKPLRSRLQRGLAVNPMQHNIGYVGN